MFKWLADVTTLTEKDMSKTSLKRLQFFTFLSIPLFPLVAISYLNLVPDFVPEWSVGFGIIGAAIGLLFLMFSRVTNRVWVRDQYLDEWELRIKHRSMAFGFQVILWTVAAFLTVFIVLEDLWDVILTDVSTIGLLFGLGGILVLGQYSQLLAQLAMIQPIDADELQATTSGRKSLKVPKLATVFVLVLLILPFTLGVMSGYKNAHAVAILADEAKSVCEARGSSVHWVSTKNDVADFACIDENREAPERLSDEDSE